MPEPTPALPFAYRLSPRRRGPDPGDGAPATPRWSRARGSPHRRLVVLVLVLGLLGTGLATGLPDGSAQALPGEDCRPGWVVDISGTVSRDENWLC